MLPTVKFIQKTARTTLYYCFLLFADTKKELIQHESLICVKVYLLTPLLVNIKQKVEINTELILDMSI